MANNIESEKYVAQLMADLSLNELEGKEREDTVNMLRERFEEVIFNTTVRVLPESEKVEYLKAVESPEQNEQKIVEITSQAPGLAEAIEAALLFEYQSLRHSLAK